MNLFLRKENNYMRPLLSISTALMFFAISSPLAFAWTGPANYFEGFEEGGLFFDDGVGVWHIRQSGSTAETDYAPGISAS